jgi:hypothetical protein
MMARLILAAVMAFIASVAAVNTTYPLSVVMTFFAAFWWIAVIAMSLAEIKEGT